MVRQSLLYVVLVSLLLMTACRTSKPFVSSGADNADAKSYINRFGSLAVSEMKRTGVPASITLAQGMIESDFGRSTLTRDGNNHFGIKCHDDWMGPVIRHDDDRRNECFRSYSRPEDSFYDHSDFLKSTPRYAALFDLPRTDYKGWARGLQRAGYATNPDYANMLIRKIEENNLYYYDTGKQPQAISALALPKEDNSYPSQEKTPTYVHPQPAGAPVKETVQRVHENNRIQYIIVKAGETAFMIENEFQLLKWELSKYNEMESGFTPLEGQILYLQPKRDKAEPGEEVHVAINGDTMYSISQKYGVKVKKLYEYNRMSETSEPVAGDKIYLRGIKPVN